MPAEGTEDKPVAAPSPKGRLVPVMIVAALMGVEGVGVFFLANALSPDPVSVLGETLGDGETNGANSGAMDLAEVELAECRPSNLMSGQIITFQIRVTALVAAVDLERAEELAEANRARIQDGVNTVMRSAEPKYLSEPTLQTLRRRLKKEFDQIFGDDQLIKRVLIPQLHQSSRGV